MSDHISGSACSTSNDRKRHISEETPCASSISKQRKPIEFETLKDCSITNEQMTVAPSTVTPSHTTGPLLRKRLCGAQIGVQEPSKDIAKPTMEDGSQTSEGKADAGCRSPENEQSREILSMPHISASVTPALSDSVQTRETQTIAGQSIPLRLEDIHSAQGLLSLQNYTMGQIRATASLTSWGSLDNDCHKQLAPQTVNYRFQHLLTAGPPLCEHPGSIDATVSKPTICANALSNQNNCLPGISANEMFTSVDPDLIDGQSALSTVFSSSVLKPSGDKSLKPVSQNTRDTGYRNMSNFTDIAGPSSWEPSLDFHMFPETFSTGDGKTRSKTEGLSLYEHSFAHKVPPRDGQPISRMPIISESPRFDAVYNICSTPVTSTLYQRSADSRLPTLEDLGTSLQEELINYYWTNESRIPVSPLAEEHSVPLVNFYVIPPMKAYVKPAPFSKSKHNAKQNSADSTEKDPETIRVGSYQDLFIDRDNTQFKNIYISAPAGMGKTSFSQSLTITWCQAHRPDQSISDKFTKVNLEAMRYFDLLFLIHLRDYQGSDCCNVDDMISDMLSKCLTITDKYPRQLIQHLLEEKRCLVVLDGLDEWTHPATCPRKPPVPHNNHTNLCTTVTTTRPWKLSIVGLAANNIDRHVEICLLDGKSSEELEVNAVNILNENNSIPEAKNLNDFDTIVMSVDIGEIRHIPYVKLLLICLWYDGEPIGESRCKIYSNVIELTLKRGLRKPDLPIINTSKTGDAVPKCMKNNELCSDYINLLLKIGQLAFFSLFHKVKESSLIISRKTVLKYMDTKELEFCLKTGLLSQNKDSGRISDISYNVSFQHKSIQEYFSALFITAEWCKDLTRVTIMNFCTSLREVLEVSNVFIFTCGMKPDVYSCIVHQVLERDEISRNYRSSGMNGGDMDIMQSYQDMQIAAFVESLKNKNERYPIPLQDIIFGNDIIDWEHGAYFISQLMSNTNSVQSIYMYGNYLSFYDQNVVFEDIPLISVNWFHNLEAFKKLTTETNIISYLLTYSGNSLKYLYLDSGSETFFTHKTVEMIFSSIANCTMLESIKMDFIRCGEDDCCGFKLSLSQLSRLKTLDLSRIYLSELDLPEHSQLQELSLSAVRLSVLDLSECSQMSELTLNKNYDFRYGYYESDCPLRQIILRLNIKSLKSCKISGKYVLPHDNLWQLFQFIGDGEHLKNIEILQIQCSDHPNYCTGVPLTFSYQCELESLRLKWISLSQLDINKCSLLTSLDLVDIPLSHLDLSLNTQLQNLSLSEIPLGQLNLTMCTQLQTLSLREIPLSQLDLAFCTQLQTLSLREIPLSQLDLAFCTQLQTLSLSEIPLSQLDLTLCTQLQSLDLWDIPLHELYLNTCSLEKCIIFNRNSSYPIQVDIMLQLYNSIKRDRNGVGNLILPHENIHQLFCSIGIGNRLKTLLLQQIQCSDHDKCPGIPFTFCHQDQLEQLDLKGIPLNLLDTSLCSQLRKLVLYDIPLCQLDLSRNHQLLMLDLRKIPLCQLDLKHNSKLNTLILKDIPLIELFLNTDSLVSCEIYQDESSQALSYNSLHQLLGSFENWRMFKKLKLKNLKCTDRPKNCTGVSMNLTLEHNLRNTDPNWNRDLKFTEQFTLSHCLASTALRFIDITSVEIEKLYLVHDTIHQILRSLGNIHIRSNVILNNIQCLDHPNSCPGVQLTISQDSKVKSIEMQKIPISELNIFCNQLEDLHFKDMPLRVLDISQVSNLNQLHLEEIPLSILDITQNSRLTDLRLKNLPLSVLDISRNSELKQLHLERIPISVLDITQNSLINLHLEDIPLSLLDIAQNNNLKVLHIEKTPLTELIVKTEHPSDVTPTDFVLFTWLSRKVYLTEITTTASVFRHLFLIFGDTQYISFKITLNGVTMPASAWKELLVDILQKELKCFTINLQLCKGPSRQEWENIVTEHSSLSGIKISTDSDAVSVYVSGTIENHPFLTFFLNLNK